MKKPATNQSNTINSYRNLLNRLRKNGTVKKISRYIYTEKDLGEGILDLDMSAYYNTSELKLN